MKHELEFNEVLLKLHAWREQALAGLRSPENHEESLRLKRQLDAAVRCLEFCQQHQIHPATTVCSKTTNLITRSTGSS